MTTARIRIAGRVLVYDPDKSVRSQVAELLLSEAKVPLFALSASNLEEAMRAAARQEFEVALLRTELSEAHELPELQQLRALNPSAEFVVVSATASLDVATACVRERVAGYTTIERLSTELVPLVEDALHQVESRRVSEGLERRYRNLVELTEVTVIALDASENIALFNRKASALTGIPQDEALLVSFVERCIVPRDRQRMREALAIVREESRVLEVEAGTITADGTRRVRWHMSPAREPGLLVYVIGIDVTDRIALEKRAADHEAMSAMGRLALNMAHEIRNPLNAAVLQLHMLSRHVEKLAVSDDEKETLRKRVTVVGDEIGRLNRLLSEFLDLSRPRAILREPVHVGRLVSDVLELEAERAGARGVRVVRELAADACIAIGDREKLKQVAINLVVNALDAMPEGGELRCSVMGYPEEVEMVFEDTGPGIPAENLEQVFETFFTTKPGGTGLGLAIVKQIIDQHAGRTVITSEVGVGTKVRVAIPTGRPLPARSSRSLLPEPMLDEDDDLG